MQYTNCTNFGIQICATFFKKTLDKICDMWYNIKSGALAKTLRTSARHRQKKSLSALFNLPRLSITTVRPTSIQYLAGPLVHICNARMVTATRESCLWRSGLTSSTCEFRASRLPFLNSVLSISYLMRFVNYIFVISTIFLQCGSQTALVQKLFFPKESVTKHSRKPAEFMYTILYFSLCKYFLIPILSLLLFFAPLIQEEQLPFLQMQRLHLCR